MEEAPDLVPHGARFNFGRELRKARRAVEERVAAYAAEHPELGYRDLCKRFSLSLGAMSKIMRRRQKPRASRDSFVVRHTHGDQRVVTVVTITGRATIERKQQVLSGMYKTADIVAGNDPSVTRRVEYTVQQLGIGRWRK